MPTTDDHDLPRAANPPAHLSGSDRRTYEALFHHPSSHNVKWHDAVHLFEVLGTVTEKPNHEYVFVSGDAQHVMRRPHSKDLTAEEIRDLRHFLASASEVKAETPALDLLIAMDHHEARIFAVDLPAHGTSVQEIRPYDPHHFLHHLTHKDQPGERGQRAHEDATFYERIAQAVAQAERIVIIGRGTGKSDAAAHLREFLVAHHGETAQKLRATLTADLSHVTAPALVAMAREALAKAPA
jgi:hypothetical protein